AIRYANELRQGAESNPAGGTARTAGAVERLIDELVDAIEHLVAQNAELGGDDVHSKSRHMRDNILPAMAEVRAVADRLEKVVPDDLWPLPTYRDMLFVK